MDDLLGNGTSYSSSSCNIPNPLSCSFTIKISLLEQSWLINPHPIQKSLDMEILISSISVIVQFITIAYSLYYLTCFRQMMELAGGKETSASTKEDVENNDVVLFGDTEYRMWSGNTAVPHSQLKQPLLE